MKNILNKHFLTIYIFGKTKQNKQKIKNGGIPENNTSQLDVALVVQLSHPKQSPLYDTPCGWLSIFPLNTPIGRELINVPDPFYSSSKPVKFIHNIRIIALIYIRYNMNIGLVTGLHCSIFGQMAFLELCRLLDIIED